MIATKQLSPYKGLVPFGDSKLDALLFFGREREGQIISANVLAARLTVLYGPSGVGKTSVLRAGVAYRLRELALGNIEQRGHPEFAVVVFDAWSDEPISGIRQAVREELSALFGSALLDEREGESLADTLGRWTDALACDVLLVLDQAEEYFLYHSDESGFADELPELVTRPGLRVRVLLSLRDDALAKLDRFKGRIPSLFANYLRLDHLDRRAARDAIVKPVERYNDVEKGEPVEIEPALIEAVLTQTAAGKVDLSEGGRGLGPGETDESRIEAPYLQLVMERVWEEEGAQGFRVLRAETLERLGGAQAIARTHLRRAVEGLSSAERDVAADVFRFLVTPSGTKIAHGVGDLAEYATVDAARLLPVLHTLGRERIIRPVNGGEAEEARYEIFHDVLAEAVLAWRTRHDAEAAIAREREAARRRHRRLAWLAAVALLALAAMTALAAYAFSQRGEAQKQAASASAQRALAVSSAELAKSNAADAEEASRDAVREAKRATENEAQAKQDKVAAQEATAEADRQKDAAQKATDRAESLALDAASNEAEATQAKNIAEDQKALAVERKRDADVARSKADNSARKAEVQRDKARGSALVAQSLAALAVDPENSARLAVRATKYGRTIEAENALRASLVAMRVEHILPGVGTGPDGLARFSANGARVVVGGGKREVRVYRAGDAGLLKVFRADAVLNDAVLNSDGTLVAAAGADGRVRVWDVESGTLRVIDHQAPARGVAWSPQGDVLATVGSGSSPTAQLWNAASWSRLHLFGHTRALENVSFSLDGRRIVTTGEGRVARVFDVATGIPLATLEHPLGQITSAALSPNGELVVTGGRDRIARVWDAATGELRFTTVEHFGQVLDVAFAPNGERIATSSLDSLARIFSAKTGALEDTLRGHSGPPVNSVEFSPKDNNAFVTASADETARYWGPAQLGIPLLGHTKEVLDASFSPSGLHVLTASRDGFARIWDPYGEPRVRVLNSHARSVTTVAVDPSGSQIASGTAGGLVRVSSLDGRVVRSLPLGSPVVSVAWARGGLLLAATRDGVIRIWSGAGSRLVATIEHGGRIRGAALSSNGQVVATAGDNRAVRLWRLPSGSPLPTIAHPAAVTSVALDQAGDVVASASGPNAYLSRSESGALLHELQGHSNTVRAVAFDATGRKLATASNDRDAVIWDVRTGIGRKRLVGHGGAVVGVAFSPDGRWLATAGPIKAGVWQVGKSDLPRSFLFFLTGYDQPLTSVAFSQRGWTIVTGTSDGTVRSYQCVYCGDLRQLVPFANQRLNRLAKERKR